MLGLGGMGGLLENVRLENRIEGREGRVLAMWVWGCEAFQTKETTKTEVFKAVVCMHGVFEEHYENLCGWEKRVRRRV